jgi:predicted AlkP superfamily phosphohydrolase/phosphomutase
MRHLSAFVPVSILAVVSVGACAVLGASCGDDRAAWHDWKPAEKRLVVLGVDGMDPRLVEQYMRAGRMPHLKALAERGTMMPLATTFPPQSPVAWSTFITGMHAPGHGIYDFVHRDPHALSPYLSTSRTQAADTWKLGPWLLPDPFSSSKIELLRGGRAFWQILEEHQVPATVVQVPANFPPAASRYNESMSGMGTPDLLGTYGIFQVFTDDAELAARKLTGGLAHAVDFRGGQRASGALQGPPDPLSAKGEPLTVPLEVVRDPERDVALVRLGEEEVVLQPGEWSEWIPVGFELSLSADALPGMVRLYLDQVRPHLALYASPTNIDPTAPAMPISSPAAFAEGMAHDVGRFYTQGMPENTKALAAGVLSDAEFLAQADIVWDERLRMLDRELTRFLDGSGDRPAGGVLFFYFGSIDLLSHAFWRTLEVDGAPLRPEHVDEDRASAHVIPDLYARMDAVIGDVIARLGPGVDIVIMSDHGFAPYRYKVNLNLWLAQQGYLAILPPEQTRPGVLGHIDWEHTQAYALGLNQVFINLQGREAHGVVPPDEYDVLVDRLARQLEGFRDPETDTYVITEAARPGPSEYGERTPDLLVGYARGYRSSDGSAEGGVGGEEVIEPNRDKWSGDHCMHPSHVPGVLVTNRKVETEDASLIDLAPTILSYFGVAQGQAMTGTPLWRP